MVFRERRQKVRTGLRRKSAVELGMRPGDWTWRNGQRDEDLQLAYLLPCSEMPVGSHGVPCGVGASGKAMSWRE